MVRLADVAREAGVSVSTASRALSRPELIAAGTRSRVLAAAETLGYRHHHAARALVTGRTGLLAFGVPTLSNPFYAPVIAGAQEAAEQADCELIVVVTEGSPAREETLFARLAHRVDGFAIAAPAARSGRLAGLAAQLPLVTLNRQVRGVDSVLIDTPVGVGEIGTHLAGLGHRRLTYLGGPVDSWMDPRRLRGLRDAVPECDVVALGPYPPDFEAGAGAADAVLASHGTAVVAYSSSLLLGLLHRLTMLGHRIPGELSLACADDLSAAGLAMPEITALHLPAADAGRRSVERLLARVASPELSVAHQRLAVRLQVGTSTAAPASGAASGAASVEPRRTVSSAPAADPLETR